MLNHVLQFRWKCILLKVEKMGAVNQILDILSYN